MVPDFWKSEKSRMKNDMNEHDDFWPDLGLFGLFEQDINLFQSPNRLNAPAKRNLQAWLLMILLPDIRNTIKPDHLVHEFFEASIKIQLLPVIRMRLHYKFQNVHLKESISIGQKHTWPGLTRRPNWMAMIWILVQVLRMATKSYLGIVIQIISILKFICIHHVTDKISKWT